MPQAISRSSWKRTKMRFTIAARMMPANMQTSHAGKNEPTMLNVGERLQPDSAGNVESCVRRMSDPRRRIAGRLFLLVDMRVIISIVRGLSWEPGFRSDRRCGKRDL